MARRRREALRQIELPEVTVTVIQEEAPIMILVFQKCLIERANPMFYHPKYLTIMAELHAFDTIPFDTVAEEPVSGWRAGPIQYIDHPGSAIVKVGDILNTGVDWSSVQFINTDHPANAQRKRILSGDILICRSGEGGVGQGKLCYVHDLPYPACVHGHVYRVRFQDGWGPLASVFLKTRYGRLQIDRFTSGVGSPELDKDDILKFVLPNLEGSLRQIINFQAILVASFHNEAIKAKIAGNLNKAESNLQIAEGMLETLILQVEKLLEGEREGITPLFPEEAPEKVRNALIEEYRCIGGLYRQLEEEHGRGRILGIPMERYPEVDRAIGELLKKIEGIEPGEDDCI